MTVSEMKKEKQKSNYNFETFSLLRIFTFRLLIWIQFKMKEWLTSIQNWWGLSKHKNGA